VMRDMGYLGGAGDSKPNFDDLDDAGDEAGSPDSDDDEMPDLEWREESVNNKFDKKSL